MTVALFRAGTFDAADSLDPTMLHRHAQLFRAEPRIIAFGAFCAFLSSPGQTFFIALFVGSFGAATGLNAAQLGALYLAATLGSASLLPFAGQWIDRIDLRRYVAFVTVGLAVACFTTSMLAGPLSLFFALLMLRFTGQGLLTHVEVTSVARYFTSRRGLALSTTAMGFALAMATTPPLAVLMIDALGWRVSYAAIGAFALCVALPILLWLIFPRPDFTAPPSQRQGLRRPRAWDGLRIVASTRYFWLALPILLYMPFTSTALTFHIESLALMKGWTRELVATSFTGFAAGHLAGLLLSGHLVDRLSARSMLPLMNLPAFVGIAVLGLFDHPGALFVFFAALGMSSGLVQTTIGAVWAEVYGVSRLGTIRSFVTMLTVAGTAAGPALLGLGVDIGLPVGAVCSILLLYGIAAALVAALGISTPVAQSDAI